MTEYAIPPYFGICIPVFNGARFVERAVESVLAQTCHDWRLLVCDNQSTDDTWEKLQRFSRNPRVVLLRNAQNLGMVGNINRMLEEAQGKWVGILPADDAYTPEALATIRRETESNERLILWMHAHRVSGDGIAPHICAVFPESRNFEASTLAATLYTKGNIFGELSSYFFRHAPALSNGLRFSGSNQTADVKMWIELLSRNPGHVARYWPEALAEVCQHPESVSNSNLRSGAAISELFRFAGQMSHIRWSRATLVRQFIRLLFCWVKLHSRLPKDARQLPIQALIEVGRAFYTRRS